jgi:predicted MPP superfamily phosphohydrolase
MTLRFALFFVVLLAVLAAASLYVQRRAVRAFGLRASYARGLGIVLFVAIAALVAGRALARALPEAAAATLATAGSTVLLAVLIAAPLLLFEGGVRGLVRLGWRAARRARFEPGRASAAPAPRPPPPGSPTVPRRALLEHAAAQAALAAGVGGALYGTLRGRHDYVIEELAVRMARLPHALDGFTIAQLSDVHLGLLVGDDAVRAAEDLVRAVRPDLVVLTGDLVDHDERYCGRLGTLVRRLRAHARVLAVPGNHDYYAGIGEVLGALARAGAEVLVNRSVSIGDGGGRLAVAGVDDVWAARFGQGRGPDLDRALAGVGDETARVLLSHNPVFFAQAAARVDLQLSGHTHGGQVNLGVRPADLLLPHGWVAGAYRRGEAQLYVNRGFGTAGPPARLGAPPEVTKIILTS